MADYIPQTWTAGSTFTPAQATAISQQLDEEETINVSQQAQIDALTASAATTNTSVSIVNELPLFNDTSGKQFKRATTLSGIVKAISGVVSAAVAGTDYVTPTGSETLSSKTINNPTIVNYTEAVVSMGAVTTAATISLTNGTIVTATLTASTTCVFAMPTATAGKSFTLLLKQPVTAGNGAATFTGARWPGSTAPTVTSTAGRMDVFNFTADGTNWYGSYQQNYTY